MRTHIKRIIAVLACVAIMVVIAMPISADYIKDYYPYMRYAVGESGTIITANGQSNYEYYSEEFSGGGKVSNSTYYPTIALNTSTDNYDVTSESFNENYTEVTKEYNNQFWGYISVPHSIRVKKNLNALTFNRTYVIDGKFGDIFNDYVGISMFLPYSRYMDANEHDMLQNKCTVQISLNCLDSNGAKVSIAETINRPSYGTRGGYVSNVSVLTDAIGAIETELQDYSERTNTTYLQNQRCRVVFTVTDVITNYDMNDSLPNESRLYWESFYPVSSTNGTYTPNSATVPYNLVDNKIDTDTDFTQWIGTAISGIWSFELIPNISIGAILIAILSTCIVIAFLKFFAGG